jgi:predicted 2-oxoglutarate/Fe(II)-dependent dioxygenase YbiX/peroxiredoxin
MPCHEQLRDVCRRGEVVEALQEARPRTTPSRQFRNLLPGDHAPWFGLDVGAPNELMLHHAGGRYVVLCFFGSARLPHAQEMMAALKANRQLFDSTFAIFCGVSFDPADAGEGRIGSVVARGLRFTVDRDYHIGRLYGALPEDAAAGEEAPYRGMWLVLDPTLRIMAQFPMTQQASRAAEVMSYLNSLPPPGSFAGVSLQAPILMLPNVFERELCQRLIALHDSEGGRDSGVMRIVDGKTQEVIGRGKKRNDYVIRDPALRRLTHERIARRVLPEILKTYQCRLTRIQRYTIGCYSAEDGGHFGAHRDNTTPLTAHRRFAVSVVLNDDYDGGLVGFPEYGSKTYKAPIGGAVVFSCSLLHEVSSVTRGKRYVFLPFLFDEPAMEVYRKAHPEQPAEGTDITFVPSVPHPSGSIVYGDF